MDDLDRLIEDHSVMRTAVPGAQAPITRETCVCGLERSQHAPGARHPFEHILAYLVDA